MTKASRNLHPILWDPDVPVGINLEKLVRLKKAMDNLLGEIGPDREWEVDEFAVMSPTRSASDRLANRLVSHSGVEMFNSASDRVWTRPFMTEYDVEYSFLRTPNGFRLELMTIGSGFSPLHSAMTRSQRDMGSVVHASFRCSDWEDYSQALRSMESNAVHGQTCESKYGQFSYWLPFSADKLLFLKPRINLRDTTPKTAEEWDKVNKLERAQEEEELR